MNDIERAVSQYGIQRCVDITKGEWDNLMRHATPTDYESLKGIVKRNFPMLYDALVLDFANPYGEQSTETPTHYVLVHSAIEFFIPKTGCVG